VSTGSNRDFGNAFQIRRIGIDHDVDVPEKRISLWLRAMPSARWGRLATGSA
jgi:hypothetical protein